MISSRILIALAGNGANPVKFRYHYVVTVVPSPIRRRPGMPPYPPGSKKERKHYEPPGPCWSIFYRLFGFVVDRAGYRGSGAGPPAVSQTDGTITLPGLEDEVHVYRDEYGIPQIYAQNEARPLLAPRVTFTPRIASGRWNSGGTSARVASPRSPVKPPWTTDIFIRTMGWNRIAEESLAYYESEAPEMLAILEAYSAGVNAYITEQVG